MLACLIAFVSRLAGWLAGAVSALVAAVMAAPPALVHNAHAWSQLPPMRTMAGPMRMIAHRGASAVMPENTIRAALAALDSGADGVEYDLQQLADGTLVVLHDETLRRTAVPGSEGGPSAALLDTPVCQLYHSQLERVDVGGEALPTFEWMLAALLARDPPRLSFAELKSGSDELMVAEALSVCRKMGAGAAEVVFISFGAEVCAKLKKAAPEYRVLLLGACEREGDTLRLLQRAVSLGLDGIDVAARPGALTPAIVRAAHAAGLLVATWVSRAPASNDREAVWEYSSRANVDFFTTNLPPAACAWAYRRRAADGDGGRRRLQ